MDESNINYKQSKHFDTSVKMKSNERLKEVPYSEPKTREHLKEEEYNLDDLFAKIQDEVIKKYIEHNIVIRHYAVDVLRHFVFNKDGKIIRGFDK